VQGVSERGEQETSKRVFTLSNTLLHLVRHLALHNHLSTLARSCPALHEESVRELSKKIDFKDKKWFSLVRLRHFAKGGRSCMVRAKRAGVAAALLSAAACGVLVLQV
jgi:hypothetical protein